MKQRQVLNITVVLAYAVIVLITLWPILTIFVDKLVYGEDIHAAYYFFRSFFRSSIRNGEIPWWNPYTFTGGPFMANPIVSPFYPLNWLFIIFPLNQAFSLHIAFHITLAMSSMYFLVNSFFIKNINKTTGLVVSFTSGLIFGLSGFFTARIWAGHVDVIAAASYMPLVYMMFLKISNFETKNTDIRGINKTHMFMGKWLINLIDIKVFVAGSTLALQLISGYQTMAMFTLEAIFITSLLQSFYLKSFWPIIRVSMGVIVGLGLSAFHLIPEQQVIVNSIRTFQFSYDWVSYGSVSFDSLKQFINPFIFGDQFVYKGIPPNFWEHAAFFGRISLFFSIYGIIVGLTNKNKRQTVLIFTVIAVTSIWICLGKNVRLDILHWLYNNFFLYQRLRFPSRHIILFVFSATVLYSIGLNEILNKLKIKPINYLFLLIISIEMIIYTRHFLSVREIPDYRQDMSIVKIMNKDPELYRLLPNFGAWTPPAKSMDFDSPMHLKYFSLNGYDPTILRNYYEFIDAVNGNTIPSVKQFDVQIPYFYTDSKYIDFLNVKYIVSYMGYDVYGGVSTDLYTKLQESQTHQSILYENLNVLPRFFLVPAAKVVANREQVANEIRKGFDLSTKVLLEEKYLPEKLRNVEFDCKEPLFTVVHIKSYKSSEIILDSDNPCSGFLTSSETMYPGWRAYLDGKSTDIFEGNLAFRTLYLPKGKHEIRLVYQPTIFVLGGIISISLLIIYSFIFYKQHKKTNN